MSAEPTEDGQTLDTREELGIKINGKPISAGTVVVHDTAEELGIERAAGCDVLASSYTPVDEEETEGTTILGRCHVGRCRGNLTPDASGPATAAQPTVGHPSRQARRSATRARQKERPGRDEGTPAKCDTCGTQQRLYGLVAITNRGTQRFLSRQPAVRAEMKARRKAMLAELHRQAAEAGERNAA
jgi:hypothetical protein